MEKVSVQMLLLPSLWSSTEVRRMSWSPAAQRPITYQGVAVPSEYVPDSSTWSQVPAGVPRVPGGDDLGGGDGEAVDGRGPGRVLPGGGLAGVRVGVVGPAPAGVAITRPGRTPGTARVPCRGTAAPVGVRGPGMVVHEARGRFRRGGGPGSRGAGRRAGGAPPDSRRPRWPRRPPRPGGFCGTAVQLWSWAGDPQVSGTGRSNARVWAQLWFAITASASTSDRRGADQYWS